MGLKYWVNSEGNMNNKTTSLIKTLVITDCVALGHFIWHILSQKQGAIPEFKAHCDSNTVGLNKGLAAKHQIHLEILYYSGV